MLGDFPVRRQPGLAVPSRCHLPQPWDTRDVGYGGCGEEGKLRVGCGCTFAKAQPSRAALGWKNPGKGRWEHCQPRGMRRSDPPLQDTGKGRDQETPGERGKGPASKHDPRHSSSEVELTLPPGEEGILPNQECLALTPCPPAWAPGAVELQNTVLQSGRNG